MKHPSSWNRSDLHHHLQHALNLELWTIPLYLTALYSIKDLKKLKHNEYPDAAKLILSVVVQEMLHMELVCNISNALGHSPRFEHPSYDEQKGIPFIHPAKNYLPPELNGYTVKPHALNENSLRLFCAIELPHPKKEIDWEKEKTYNSIADLYEALKMGISALWNECYVGDERNTKQKNTFTEYHNIHGKSHGFSQNVHSVETAIKAIDAIIEQGEGADTKHVPADFRPHPVEGGKGFETGGYKGNLSHYQKFRMLLHSHNQLPSVYTETNGEKNMTVQQNLKKIFSDFLAEMQDNFNNDLEEMPDPFWKNMFALGDALTAVWESGLCPDFNFTIIDKPGY
ncbi:MAG TPA: ferritin-like protein [Chitinophagaceae bacterium]|nr:ferritin-like protein [Chitinophagaceae bacterium]